MTWKKKKKNFCFIQIYTYMTVFAGSLLNFKQHKYLHLGQILHMVDLKMLNLSHRQLQCEACACMWVHVRVRVRACALSPSSERLF